MWQNERGKYHKLFFSLSRNAHQECKWYHLHGYLLRIRGIWERRLKFTRQAQHILQNNIQSLSFSIIKWKMFALCLYLNITGRRKSETKVLTFFRYSATLEGTFCGPKWWTESVKAIANTLLRKSEKYFIAYNKNVH